MSRNNKTYSKVIFKAFPEEFSSIKSVFVKGKYLVNTAYNGGEETELIYHPIKLTH